MKDVTNSARPKNKKKYRVGGYALLAFLAFLYYYFMLPPLHYAAWEFWLFLGLLTLGVLVVEGLSLEAKENSDNKALRLFPKFSVSRKFRLLLGFWALVAVFWLGSYVIFSPVFMAKNYSQLLTVAEKDFKKDFPETDIKQIPLLDRDSAERLGNRHLGALSALVSQFGVAADYTQINIKSHPYRVSPLNYAGFFRWLNHFKTGLPYYMQVDMVTGDAELIKPQAPIKYSRADKFFRQIDRYLRFRYPFRIFGEPTFEVDDQGQPYYVATTYERYFVTREPKPSRVILVNASTGECQDYEMDQVPSWVDRVQSSDLILHQLTLNGHYQNGFWNSLFSKVGVTEPTEGYNYLPIDDDIYLYTGLTSVTSDASNIGFVLVNMRTREARRYPLTAAAEFSAMESAEGSVQEKGYHATFPLLINVKGRPLYILSLKDGAGLIKQYALVDVLNYQQVMTSPSIKQLMADYLAKQDLELAEGEEDSPLEEISGQIDQIKATVVDGNSVFYLRLGGKIYRAPLAISDQLPFVEAGDRVKMGVQANGQVREFALEERP